MDNLTHSLVGLAAAKAGLERLSPGATAACVLAANAPDLDILAVLGGKWAYVQHHRGITHSIVGTIALSLLIPSLFYAVDFLIARVRKKQRRVKFRGLLIVSLIVGASHPLMDWTNNYGVRPFLPWRSDWYYGDLVFIIDPWLWLLVGGAAFLLTSARTWQTILWGVLALGLTGLVFSTRLESTGLLYPGAFRALWIAGIIALAAIRLTHLTKPWGSRTVQIALALVLMYWGGLAVAHSSARAEAQAIAAKLSTQRGETLGNVAAMPTLADPFRWMCVADTDRATYRFFLHLMQRGQEFSGEVARFAKPQGGDAVAFDRASMDERARTFLNFARFPAARVGGDCLSKLLVQFADIRYTEPGASRGGTFSLEVAVGCDSQADNKK